MITKENILKAQEEFIQALQPIKERQRAFELEMKEETEQAGKPFLELLDEYYDQEIKDSVGTSIRKGYIIQHNDGLSYIVIDRSMQIVLGTIMFNPKLTVKRISIVKGERKIFNKTISVHRSNLMEYTIISTQ